MRLLRILLLAGVVALALALEGCRAQDNSIRTLQQRDEVTVGDPEWPD